jgi:Holliday junction resolvase RusA-like endonuclease
MIVVNCKETGIVAKPRMTRSDAWKKRDCVEKYWLYKDHVRQNINSYDIPEAYHLIFLLEMPKSWSQKKKSEMLGKPHQQKPDKDNLEKGFLDAVFDEDSHVWDGRVTKLWWREPLIVLLPVDTPTDWRNLIFDMVYACQPICS